MTRMFHEALSSVCCFTAVKDHLTDVSIPRQPYLISEEHLNQPQHIMIDVLGSVWALSRLGT